MISFTLWKRNLKVCTLPFLVIFAMLCMYTTVIAYMYNPELSEMLSGYQQALPELMAAVGMTGIASSLLEWMQIYLYGFIMLLFPLIFILVMVQKLSMIRVVSAASSPSALTAAISTGIILGFSFIIMGLVTSSGQKPLI